MGSLGFGIALGRHASAQQPTGKKTVQAVEKFLTTDDAWQIAITYRNLILGQNAPVVILLHRLGSDRLVWEGKDGLAERLSKEGYAVVSVDLRKHGQSKGPTGGGTEDGSKPGKSGDAHLKPVDYERMVDNDLEAVKGFLFKEHQSKNLNMNKTAIIASESSAPIAIHFALRDWLKRPYPDGPTLEASTPRGQDVRALVFLSPEANLRGAPTNQALLQLRNPEWRIASLICFGTLDTAGAEDARRIHLKLGGTPASKEKTYKEKERANKEKEPVYLEPYPFKLRGTDLLLMKDRKCEDDVLAFLQTNLMELPGDWRDRKNRLTSN